MVVFGIRALRCAITDLSGPGLTSPHARKARLEEQMRRWAAQGIEFVQLREKHLDAGELLALAEISMAVLQRQPAASTRLLINGRPDIAAAAGAHGVHLTGASGELTPDQARKVFAAAGRAECLVSSSCHTVADVVRARALGADFILFGPVFEKRIQGRQIGVGTGLETLKQACEVAGEQPVLALGGVTFANGTACLQSGASGLAGIRLFD